MFIPRRMPAWRRAGPKRLDDVLASYQGTCSAATNECSNALKVRHVNMLICSSVGRGGKKVVWAVAAVPAGPGGGGSGSGSATHTLRFPHNCHCKSLAAVYCLGV